MRWDTWYSLVPSLIALVGILATVVLSIYLLNHLIHSIQAVIVLYTIYGKYQTSKIKNITPIN